MGDAPSFTSCHARRVSLLRSGLLSKLLVNNPTGWEAEAGGALDLADGGGLVQLLARYQDRSQEGHSAQKSLACDTLRWSRG